MSALAAESDWLAGVNGSNVRDFYQELGLDLPAAGGSEAMVSCFADPGSHKRDDRNKSCSVNLGSGLWKCHGCGKSGNAYQAAISVGFPERRARDLSRKYGLFLEGLKGGGEKPRMPHERSLKKWRHALMANWPVLDRAWEVKGWTPYGLLRCGVGWDGERFTIPVRDSKLKVVGLVRYLPGAEKKSLALPGSKRDLWPSPEFLARKKPVFLVEGEPDAISVRGCQHQVVSIPGAASWRAHWGPRFAKFSRVIMLPDCDRQGRDLADRVALSVPRIKIVDLDSGRDDGYDVGDMIAECSREGGIGQVSRALEWMTS